MLPTSRLKSTNDCYLNLSVIFLFESKGIHAEARGFGIQLCDPAARGWSLGKHLGVETGGTFRLEVVGQGSKGLELKDQPLRSRTYDLGLNQG